MSDTTFARDCERGFFFAGGVVSVALTDFVWWQAAFLGLTMFCLFLGVGALYRLLERIKP